MLMIKVMKKVLGFFGGLGSQLFFVSSVLADTTIKVCPEGTFGQLCSLKTENSLPAILTALLVIAVIIALFFLIFGGIKWVISGGDKTNVEAARNTIVAAIVGLVIVFLAWFILNVIGQFIFGKSLIDILVIPQIPR